MKSSLVHPEAPESAPSAEQRRVQNHHTLEWSPGARGGGKLPADFGWKTNPKQWQEELGTATRPPEDGEK